MLSIQSAVLCYPRAPAHMTTTTSPGGSRRWPRELSSSSEHIHSEAAHFSSTAKDNAAKFSYPTSGSTSDQIRSVTQPCPTLCDPMNRSMPGLPVHHQLPEFTHTHMHRVSDAIQPSHPLSSPSPPAPNPSQHQSLFQ